MIILDLQQTIISNLMMQMSKSDGNVEQSMFKHMVLNSIRAAHVKYRAKYGELIIACDTGSSWRKTAFPYYKANRKKDREESTLDWNVLFEMFDNIKNDLEKHFPYRTIRVEGAEADDVIGVLVHRFGSDLPGGEPILILSGDKDFKQLQTYMNVEQYDFVRNRKLIENNPEDYLLEHIVLGDKGDGIPNILSADNCLVLGVRQSTMTKQRVAALKNKQFSEFPDSERNFKRNEPLIDLRFTPKSLVDEINESYDRQTGTDRSKIFNYLMSNRMKHLMEVINDF